MDATTMQIALNIAMVMAFAMIVTIIVAWVLEKFGTHGGEANVRTTHQSLRPAMQHVRDFYAGQLKPGPLYELPRLDFNHVGTTVLIEVNADGGAAVARPPYYVNVQLRWPDRRFRMEVYPEGLLASALKLIGMRDITVGDSVFDRTYMITGNDLAAVRSVLSPRVRQLVTLLRGPGGDVHIRIVGGGLWISKRGLSGDPEELLNFVQLAVAFYDAALEQPNSGIEFLDEGVIQRDAPTCQVCGEAIERPEVTCARCYTPHHHDCWVYFGGCSIYGCRGKEFRSSSP